ncbi:hypothetical protein G3I15_24965 [Streptomyces sp. SID10244]|nr:hypothetical protein [Streptomyces sp. SID10244]
MNNEPFDRAAPSLPPPMTVGRYLRSEFPRLAKYIMGGMCLTMPGLVAIRINQYGFSWKLIGAGFAGLLIACAMAAIALLLILPIAGWWKLHTRINPYIPVTIAMVAAILGYILVFNFY